MSTGNKGMINQLSNTYVYCLEVGNFSNCYNLEIVILSKKTKNIHLAAFQNCEAFEYMHYEYTIDAMDSSNSFYAINLKKINSFDDNVSCNCTSLKSIKNI